MRDLSIIPAILNIMETMILGLVALATVAVLVKIVFELWGDH